MSTAKEQIKQILAQYKNAKNEPHYVAYSKEAKLRIKRDVNNRLKEFRGHKAVNLRRS
jgi:hypothetical protein